MRHPGQRGARARRRSARHQPTKPATVPEGWPDGDTLVETLDINAVARELLADVKPEVFRTVLQRMDAKDRKVILEPRSIPAAKVSLRAAGQVLNLIRAEEAPGESKLLGALMSPAGMLFNEAQITPVQLTGLRLRLVDLALPLIVYSESTFQGLRSWHRWSDPSFEEIALTAVIGQRCAFAGLAAAYLAVSRPDVAQRYATLREQFPALPDIAEGGLTASNPLSRYLAARPDRKLPATSVELRGMLEEDARVRNTEVEQSKRERSRIHDQEQQRRRKRDGRLVRHSATEVPADGSAPQAPAEAPSAEGAGEPVSGELRQSALPDVAEWAAAIIAARELGERLAAGDPPDPQRLRELSDLGARVRNMSLLTGQVLGREVEANRFAVDRALTEILADPSLTAKLGQMPRSAAQVRAALTGVTPPSTAQDPPDETPPDLSDLDDMLQGSVGAQLHAIATPQRAEKTHGEETEESAQEAEPATSEAAPPAAAPPPAADTPARLGDGPVSRLIAIAFSARHPGGPLAAEYTRIMAEVDFTSTGDDPTSRMLGLWSAVPMALLDASCGASPLLSAEIPELADCPKTLEFREAAAELARMGVGVYDPGVQRVTSLVARFQAIAQRAGELRDSAATRTLKYDKATKVYRSWLAPHGRLRPLVDALAEADGAEKVGELLQLARKTGASRAIDDTAAEEFASGRPKIIGGARQTLADTYDEVLALGDDHVSAQQTAHELSAKDRASSWKFEQVQAFREKAHGLVDAVEAEMESLSCPHPLVYGLTLRALSMAIRPMPSLGPELTLEAAVRHVFDERHGAS